MNLWDFLSSPMDAYERGQVKGGGLLGSQRYTRPELPVANAMRGLLDGGQDRTKRLNSSIDEAMRYFLGPTGIDKRVGAVAELNPVNDIYQAGGDMRDGDYIGAATNTAAAAVPLAGAVAAKPLAKTLAQGSDDAGRAIVDALTMYQTGGQKALGDFVADQDGAVPLYGGGLSDPTKTGWTFRDVDGNIPLSAAENRRLSEGAKMPTEAVLPIRRLYAMQDRVNPDFATTETSSGMLPNVVRKNGKMYLQDGHHRATKVAEEGGQNLRANFYDFDNVDNSLPLFDYDPSKSKWTPEDDELLAALNAPPLSPAQQEAQNVLDLLKSGRADEVTDDMLAAADDMYLFDNYDLPMDEASRMARADGMGFETGTDLYHGTDAEFQAFDPRFYGEKDSGWYGRGVTTDTDPEIASGYANYYEREGQSVMPVMSRGRHMEWPAGQEPFLNEDAAKAGTHDIQSLGYDGTRMTNDRNIYGDVEQWGTEQVTFNPANIRSRFARFDPRLSHLRNLSAGIGGMGLLGGLQLDEETRAYLAQ